MKFTIILAVVLCATGAFSKDHSRPHFKRLLVDPSKSRSEAFDPRIVGGEEATAHSIPYMAYLDVTGTDASEWLCDGSLISTKYVLTAAHCLKDAASVVVYLGAHNVSTEESTQTRVTSTSMTIHSGFDEDTIENDIGVIELPSAVTLNDYIGLVSLPPSADASKNYTGDKARISGWGLLSNNGVAPDVLYEVNSTIISNPVCNVTLGSVEDYQVCISGDGGVGACSGDSGGPLIVGNVQIGIISYGTSDCAPGSPTASTSTNSFLDWIGDNTDVTIS